jgi:hypothetical protein
MYVVECQWFGDWQCAAISASWDAAIQQYEAMCGGGNKTRLLNWQSGRVLREYPGCREDIVAAANASTGLGIEIELR